MPPQTSRTLAVAIGSSMLGAGIAAFGMRARQAREFKNPEPAISKQGPTGAFDRKATGVAEGKEASKKGKLVAFAERKNWRWLGRTLAVQTRFGELRGSNIAAAVTLQVFLALFPMLLVAAAVVGFIMNNHGDVAGHIIRSAGLSGSSAQTLTDALSTAQKSRKASSIVGLITLAWSALGISSAMQYAYNQAWQSTDRGVKDKAIGAAWLSGAALLFVASAAVTTLLNWLPAGLGIVGVLVSIVLSFALWSFTAKVLPNVDVTWRSIIPGAIVGTVGLEILKLLGAIWVPKAVASSSGLYGSIGIILAVLAFLLLFGKLVVYSAVTNVVFHEARHGVAKFQIQTPLPAVEDSNGVTRSGQA